MRITFHKTGDNIIGSAAWVTVGDHLLSVTNSSYKQMYIYED